jgi:hypothetical protein
VIEIKEVLRRWLHNRVGLRPVAETVGGSQDRALLLRGGTGRGAVRDGGEGQLTDELLGAVIEAVLPERPGRIKAWLKKDLKLTKVGDLLVRRGVEVPYRTLHR